MDTDKKVKILIAYHTPAQLLQDEILTPIHVGRAVAQERSRNGEIELEDYQWMLDNMIGDNTGENISHLNRRFCELTGIYWAWKNYDKLGDPDYIGFMHYRRHFCFQNQSTPVKKFDYINSGYLKKIHCVKQQINKIVKNYDVIFPHTLPYKSCYSQYKYSLEHKIEDLDLALEILNKKYPEFTNAAQNYMNNKDAIFCNMFIMRKDIFNDYCSWLFDILFELDSRIDYSEHSHEQMRAIGFISERLTGIYINYLNNFSKKQELKTKSFPISLVGNTDIRREIYPAFEKNNIPVCFAANDNYAPYLGVTIKSLIENSSPNNNYDLIILENSICETNKKILEEMIEGRKNFSIRFVNINGYIQGKKLFVDRYVSIETYYRIYILKILSKYKNALYIDCDTVILEDIANLYNIDIGNNLLGATYNISTIPAIAQNMFLLGRYINDYHKDILNIKNSYEYFQAGVLIMNIMEMNKQNIFDKFFEKLHEIKNPMYYDQDILNSICQGQVKFIDQSWDFEWNINPLIKKVTPLKYYEKYINASKNPKIIHYDGQSKVWGNPSFAYANYWWKYARMTDFYEHIIYKEANGYSNWKFGGLDYRVRHLENLHKPFFLISWIITLKNNFHQSLANTFNIFTNVSNKYTRKVKRKIRRRI